MGYHLSQIEGRLQTAFERAKKQTRSLGKRLGEDIGHEKALAKAKRSAVGDRHGGGENMFRRHLLTRSYNMWMILVPDSREYPIFIGRAHVYLTLRGIPRNVKHQTAKQKTIRKGPDAYGTHRTLTKITIQEEALLHAGIPLEAPPRKRDVAETRGVIKSPWSGKVLKAIVKDPPKNGGSFVSPKELLFVMEVWTKPRVKADRELRSPVGGSVVRVLVKVGEWVESGQKILTLSRPWVVAPSPFAAKPDAGGR